MSGYRWQKSDEPHVPDGTPLSQWRNRRVDMLGLSWTVVLFSAAFAHLWLGDNIAAVFAFVLGTIPVLRLVMR